MRSGLFVFIIAAAVCVYAAQASTYPTISKQILKKIFDNVKPYSDLSGAFYSIKGLELVGEKVPANSLNVSVFVPPLEFFICILAFIFCVCLFYLLKDICTFVKSKVDKTNLESIYYATSLAAVTNCVVKL